MPRPSPSRSPCPRSACSSNGRSVGLARRLVGALAGFSAARQAQLRRHRGCVVVAASACAPYPLRHLSGPGRGSVRSGPARWAGGSPASQDLLRGRGLAEHRARPRAYSDALGTLPDDLPGLRQQWAVLGFCRTLAGCGLAAGGLLRRAHRLQLRWPRWPSSWSPWSSSYLASSTRLDVGHSQFLLVTTLVPRSAVGGLDRASRSPALPWLRLPGSLTAELVRGRSSSSARHLPRLSDPVPPSASVRQLCAMRDLRRPIPTLGRLCWREPDDVCDQPTRA